MTTSRKSQVCDKCHHLNIQCSLVLGGARQGPKWKAESDMEEAAQPKQLMPIVEASGERTEMRGEPSTREILMEQSELLMDLQALFTQQLEEVRRTSHAVMVVGFAVNLLMERMSQMEEKNRSGNDRAWSM